MDIQTISALAVVIIFISILIYCTTTLKLWSFIIELIKWSFIGVVIASSVLAFVISASYLATRFLY